ncbi:hypothetical protein QQS21_001703 [Conoideocrella luteorostrata]|uniref:Uncharacterized protein n=1 Tax=Conoideocrella luteorostrata TaxID=1105319 RepID=A0AAJ0D0B2_9HYPO|nr:hypothetical protein QQS21_001703 [Conoideocrella luteorostrata]
MKFVAATIAALAGLALGSPTAIEACTPATYRCDHNTATGKPGWDVCDTSGKWVFAGYCPPDTVCKFNAQNGSPYCVPPTFHIS